VARPAGFRVSVLAVAVAGLTMACRGSLAQTLPDGPDGLLGEYSVLVDGPTHVKFTKDGGTYFVWTREGPDTSWEDRGEARPCQETEYVALFGPRWKDAVPIGLCHKDIAIFKVKKGLRLPRSQGPKPGFLEGHTFETGYFLFIVFGGQNAYKR